MRIWGLAPDARGPFCLGHRPRERHERQRVNRLHCAPTHTRLPAIRERGGLGAALPPGETRVTIMRSYRFLLFGLALLLLQPAFTLAQFFPGGGDSRGGDSRSRFGGGGDRGRS